MDKSLISLQSVSCVYGPPGSRARALAMLDEGRSADEVEAGTGCIAGLRDVSLQIPAGEIFVVMGLSGSGKSTLIRTINRLVEPTRGKIMLGDTDVTALNRAGLLQLRRERVSMVFQNFALFPHRNLLDNVAWGLQVRGMKKADRHALAAEKLRLVGLAGREKAMPADLSGGMQQRVGLARALATDAEVLLMDEPFSALDPLTRREMQEHLLTLQEDLSRTIVFITHDPDEALRLGGRLAILDGGRLVQEGPPATILREPKNDYVRHFMAGADRLRVLRAGAVQSPLTDAGAGADRPRVREDEPVGRALQLLLLDGREPEVLVEDSAGRITGRLTASDLGGLLFQG